MPWVGWLAGSLVRSCPVACPSYCISTESLAHPECLCLQNTFKKKEQEFEEQLASMQAAATAAQAAAAEAAARCGAAEAAAEAARQEAEAASAQLGGVTAARQAAEEAAAAAQAQVAQQAGQLAAAEAALEAARAAHAEAAEAAAAAAAAAQKQLQEQLAAAQAAAQAAAAGVDQDLSAARWGVEGARGGCFAGRRRDARQSRLLQQPSLLHIHLTSHRQHHSARCSTNTPCPGAGPALPTWRHGRRQRRPRKSSCP